MKERMIKEVAQGKTIEMAKYIRYGQFNTWKPVSLETALHKASIKVKSENEFGYEEDFCPYVFRFIEK